MAAISFWSDAMVAVSCSVWAEYAAWGGVMVDMSSDRVVVAVMRELAALSIF